MVVTEDGIVTFVTFPAPYSALLGIIVVPSANIISPEQLLKAYWPMLVTEDGIVILVRLLQPLKAYDPMLVTEEGIVILVRLLQPLKAAYPMLVTVDGIVTFVIPLAP